MKHEFNANLINYIILRLAIYNISFYDHNLNKIKNKYHVIVIYIFRFITIKY